MLRANLVADMKANADNVKRQKPLKKFSIAADSDDDDDYMKKAIE